MRFLNIRQLVRNFNNEVKDLPITITKFGKPIIVISTFSEKESISKPMSDIQSDIPGVNHKVKCSAPTCYETATARGKVFDESTGDTIDVPMCSKHAIQSLKEFLK